MWVLPRINKDTGNESPPLLTFRRDVVNRIFLNYSKEDRLPSSHVEISHYSRCLLWWHKTLPGAIWTQAYSESLQISKMEGFCVTALSNYLITQKHTILDVWRGSEYASAGKQGRCNMCKKNSRRRYVKFKSTYMFW